MIAEYTREAGVRNLERQLGTIARKVAAQTRDAPARGRARRPDGRRSRPDVDDYLGPPRFRKEVAFRTSRPGVATGVAWTETGGDVLFIEATLLPGGNQNIILTGQLGNVMQESARAALSHIRAQRRGARDLAGFPGEARSARPRAGRRDPQGRPVGRRDDGDGDSVGGAQPAGAAGRRDDGRDHAERAWCCRSAASARRRWRRGASASRRSSCRRSTSPIWRSCPRKSGAT